MYHLKAVDKNQDFVSFTGENIKEFPVQKVLSEAQLRHKFFMDQIKAELRKRFQKEMKK